jgi:hypothetical protein
LKNLTEEPVVTADPDEKNPPARSTAIASPTNWTNKQSDPSAIEDIELSTSTQPGSQTSDFLQVVNAITAAPRHGNERPDIIVKSSGATFDAVVIVDRVISSMGTLNSDPRYEYGKSITGTVQGTDQTIQVITPEALNDKNDDLRRGDAWPVQITLLNWDSLYNRINARQVDENAQ